MFSVRKKEYLVDCYSNISEFYNDMRKKPRRASARNESEDYGNAGWYGTESLEEAYNLMIRGDNELYKEIKDTIKKLNIDKILGNAVKRNSTYNSVVGYQVNVPNYLSGVPTDMIANVPKKTSQKIINLIINVTISAGNSKEKYKKTGAYYFAIIDLLEKSGYRCNIYVAICERSQDEIFMFLRGKTDREPFNREKLAFILAHPGFFRRIGFKWIESCNCYGEPTRDGYGIPITDSEKIKRIAKKELNADFMVWNMQNDFKVEIEDVIERLKEQGIKIGD